jgi:endonuclease/exonuclease/phosphatase family metal-dependent hydrolase
LRRVDRRGRISLPDRSQVVGGLLWLAAASVAAWTVIRAFGLDRVYPLMSLLAFTPYVAVVAVLLALLALLAGRTPQAILLGACGVILVLLVLPRVLPDDPPEPRPTGPSLRVLGANLHVGDADVEALAEIVRDEGIAVVALSELSRGTEKAIADTDLGDLLPHTETDPRSGSNGTGILSRYPLTRLPAPGDAGNDLPTVIVSAELPGGETAEIYAIHPTPPLSPSSSAQLRRYLEAIPAAPVEGPPRLLLGDFNATLDNDALGDLVGRGYVDAADAEGEGLSPTWPQEGFWSGRSPPVTIDHAIVDERVDVLEYETFELPGSDHRAVLAGLRLP